MAEVEVDQSSLPRVQEVCQNFAVLEDGVLAHSLQEQEIEQYYTTNVQKSQLVQNDIRVAKELQDEEERRRAAQRALLRQTSRQIEEQDFQYARVIQEEIQQRAEEARRRERHDEEIAKRLQEEEEELVSSDGSGGGGGPQDHARGGVSGSASRAPHRRIDVDPVEHFSPSATRWQCSSAPSRSHLDRPRTVPAQKNPTSRSNEGHVHPIRQISSEFRESLSSDSEDLDAVLLSELISLGSQRLRQRQHSARRRRASSYHSPERDYRSLCTFSDLSEEPGGQQESRREDRRCGADERINGRRRSSRDLARTWSCRDNPDKHVHFQESTSSDRREDESRQVWMMLGHVLRERGVPVKLGGSGAPLKIERSRRDSQDFQGSQVSYGEPQPQRVFQRAATARHSFHGDPRERRRKLLLESSRADQREERIRSVEPLRTEYEREPSVRERQGSRSWRGQRLSDRRPQTTEGEPDHRAHTFSRTAPHRSHSVRSGSSSSSSGRRPWVMAAASLGAEPGRTNLDLGELQQVLQDEELARQLQEEEERELRRNSHPPTPRSFPVGDFRLAQVAQDEEIARFMQKQEIKSKRGLRELDGPGSWREHRAMMSHQDRAVIAPSQSARAERRDSEGPSSPTEGCSLDQLPPTPTSTVTPSQPIRNIAEELDPTFQARRRSTDRTEETGTTCCSPPMAHTDFLHEPTFIPPTKRQADQAGRSKPKEKRENCKQQ
ncbi:coiled-coil domain-containing protein 187 isoform X2 [Synchiropus splendidus]|uniref:coiled-coil domain-containing protein 187 isoform X2 n=1 Tax=Synchiropus splendidus TaxID=270530 RepID=UPI00237E117E|nr:coiled-coil domain-containing protein 187 isoform X2 [Synchiropus splendidus]